MTGFESGSSGIGSDRAVNCTTTNVVLLPTPDTVYILVLAIQEKLNLQQLANL